MIVPKNKNDTMALCCAKELEDKFILVDIKVYLSGP